MEHGVEVVAVMTAETGGGSGVRSDVLLAFFGCFENARDGSKVSISVGGELPLVAPIGNNIA